MSNPGKEYNRIRLLVSLLEWALTLIFLGVLSLGGPASPPADRVRSWTPHPYGRFLLFIILMGMIRFLYSVPLGFYSGDSNHPKGEIQ